MVTMQILFSCFLDLPHILQGAIRRGDWADGGPSFLPPPWAW